MKTLPASWKVGLTRDDWLNSVGTPIIAIEIKGRKETYRFASKYCIIDTKSYLDKYSLRLGRITMDCSFFEGGIGIKGQMGSFEFTMSRFDKNEIDFLEAYDIKDFQNAIINVYLTFEEVETITLSDCIQIY